MFRVQVHANIQVILEFLYRLGFWHRNHKETVVERSIKLFYSIYNCLFPISLLVGAFTSDSIDESIFLIQVGTLNSVCLVKLLHLIWRQVEILELFNGICEYSIVDRKTFDRVEDKLSNLMKFVEVFLITTSICGLSVTILSPLFSNKRTIIIKFAFPLDWRNNEFAYWMASLFLSTEAIIVLTSLLFVVISWYLMASLLCRYEVLGQQMKTIGQVTPTVDESGKKRQISKIEIDKLYLQDLIRTIESWNYLKEYERSSFLCCDIFYFSWSGLPTNWTHYCPMYSYFN